ncbi:hypothetical protein LG634_05095 [Streptomyces bambusae]|uniref:hypothetical protein n=1 Tax=Streptomyces bambusae TaxID=1550616 RepID=UPI001CFE0387|nr:hypothetical protein [Streptomyces bambusae]MCB5164213.1 hypothetical protein [Streptomyces bambusae]
MRFHTTLLLAAAAAAAGAAPAHAAGPEFQYLGTDDKVHVVRTTEGCVPASGGAGQGVVNRTGRPAVLYATPDCSGSPVAVVAAGGSRIVPGFGSVEFPVTR